MRQLARLIEVQMKEIIRDPGVILWGIGFPILMAWGLGQAFSSKPINIRSIAVVEKFDSNHILMNYVLKHAQESSSAEDQIRKFEKTFETRAFGKNKINFYITSQEHATLLLKRGITILVAHEDTHGIRYEFDPRNQEAQITYFIARSLIENNLKGHGQEEDKVQPVNVPGTRYVDFFVPGLVGMGIMMSCMWGVSYSLIERRSKKLLRRLLATPMKRSYYLFSQIFTRMIMGLIEASLLISFSLYYFHIQISGSYLDLLTVYLAGNWAFSGLSILSASRTTSIDIGTGIINAITTPMMVVSGVFFSYHNFPDWAQPIIKYLPLTLLIDTLRRVMLEGPELVVVAKELLILGLFGTLCFLFGLKIFKWY
ncbi:MAG: ABC transporter permease [Bdellovibrio sp.]|nr:ABC transporter permease [Bdellovibrio sp.]